MTTPRISVVMPAYNAASYIRASIDSILAQTLPVHEVVVVDDGSKDNTREVVESYGPPVRCITQKNAGVSAARNNGIRSATGDWIAFLDSDDIWLPEKTKLQVAELDKNPGAILVYAGKFLVSDEGVAKIETAVPPDQLMPLMRHYNCITPSCVIVRRDALLEARGFDESLRGSEDWELFFRLLRKGRFVAVTEPLTRYRVATPTSLSHLQDTLLDMYMETARRTTTADLSGIQRWLWLRRIYAALLYRAYLACRDAKRPNSNHYLFRSLLTWPAPWFYPLRMKSLLALLLGR